MLSGITFEILLLICQQIKSSHNTNHDPLGWVGHSWART